MPRPLKIVQLGLEEVVLDGRKRSKSAAQIAEDCCALLRDAGRNGGGVSESAVKRYIASLDEATVPELHRPQATTENARMLIDVGARIRGLDEYLQRWIEQAENAGVEKWGVVWDAAQQRVVSTNDEDGAIEPVPIFVADWQARAAMSREIRELLKVYTDLLARLFDAEQVKAFQDETLQAITDADPDTARRIVENLQKRQSVVRAQLLGATSI